jgi:hypothetical protein
MSNIIAGNVAIYHEVVALRSAFSRHIDWPLIENPFTLEDAIRRIAPVHVRFINLRTAVMEIRIEAKQGLMNVRQKECVLQESATGMEAEVSLDSDDAFRPGQKITGRCGKAYWEGKGRTSRCWTARGGKLRANVLL